MTYYAGVPKSTLYILILAILISSLVGERINIIVSLMTITAILLRFHITINEDFLEYKITLFNFAVFRKVFPASEIKRIKFERQGWASKNAAIKAKKGFGFQASYFKNERIIEDLEEFAVENKVDIKKTKDFLILEKYYTES